MGTAKIILTGLDNAGKTSLLIALEKKFAYEANLKDLKPTQRINRDNFSFLNQRIIRWDFGGQQTYREEYLKNKERFFTDIDLFFFVVDIQDRERYMDSVEYFEELLKFFIEKKMKIPIIVLFNKSDPNLRGTPATEKALISLKDMFVKVKGDYVVDFFETSVFAIDTVMLAFSQAFARYLPRTELIANLFEEFAAAHPCLAILLLDASGITIADHYRQQLTPEERSVIRDMRTMGLKRMVEGKDIKELIKSQLPSGSTIFGEISKFPVKNTNLTLLIFSEKEQTFKGDLQKILPRVEEILNGILKD